MADLTLKTVDLVNGEWEGPYGSRYEKSTGVSGTPKRSSRVFDKSGNDTSGIITWCFELPIPSQYTGTTGLKFNLKWAVDGLQTGNVVWGVKSELITDNSTVYGTDTYGTATTATTAVPTTANGYTTTLISHVKARFGSPSAKDVIKVCIYRDCTSASDTFTGAARLVSLEVLDY